MKFSNFTLVLLVFLKASLTFASDALVDALIRLNRGEKKQAYSILIRGFEQERDVIRKGRMALLLALANPEDVQSLRETYAAFALKNVPELAENERQKLLRIAGDKYFDQSALEKAQAAYEASLQSKEATFDDKEYSIYKLGWVYLNRNKPNEAYRMWKKWSEEHPDQGDLRDLIIRDAGRAWSEARFSENSSSSSEPLMSKLSPKDESAYFEGLLSGYRRQARPNNLNLYNSVKGAVIYTSFLNYVLADEGLFATAPCDSLPWLESADFSKLQLEPSKKLLGQCLKISQNNQNQTSHARIQKLAQLLNKIPVQGLERWPKAHAFKLAGEARLACQEYEKSIVELLAKNEHLESLPDLIENISSSCASKQTVTAEEVKMIQELFGNQKVVQLSEKDPQRWYGTLVHLVQNPTFRQTGIDTILSESKTWQKTRLPILLLEAYQDFMQAQLRIIEGFPKNPMPAPYQMALTRILKGQLAQQDLKGSRQLLEKYLPLHSQSELWAIRLWSLWIMDTTDTTDEGLKSVKSEIAETYAQILKSDKTSTPKDKQALAFLWISLEDWKSIWKHWALVSGIFSEQARYSEALLTHSLPLDTLDSETQSFVKKESSSKNSLPTYVVSVQNLLSPTPFKQAPGQLEAPLLVKKSSIHKDALALSQVRMIEPLYQDLKLVVGLPGQKTVTNRVLTLKSAVQKAARHQWSNEAFLVAAQQSINRTSDQLAGALQKLSEQDKDNQQELLGLTQLVQSWRVQ